MSGSEWAAVVARAGVPGAAGRARGDDRAPRPRRRATCGGRRATSGARPSPRSRSCAAVVRAADFELDRVDAIVTGAERVARPGRRRVRPRRPHVHEPGRQGARGRHRHPPRGAAAQGRQAGQADSGATDGRRPDVQARHVARRRLQPRCRHHRRRGTRRCRKQVDRYQPTRLVDRVTDHASPQRRPARRRSRPRVDDGRRRPRTARTELRATDRSASTERRRPDAERRDGTPGSRHGTICPVAPPRTADELRAAFLDFFAARGHTLGARRRA